MDIVKVSQIRNLIALERDDDEVLVPVGDLREFLDLAESAIAAREVLSEREWNSARTTRRVREALGIPDPVSFSNPRPLIVQGS